MNRTFTRAVVCGGWLGLLAVLPALAQTSPPAQPAAPAQAAPAPAAPKTAKQCADEWKANKATLEADGKNRKTFLAECRGMAAAAQPAALGAGQFAAEAEAKTNCPTDAVVWVNLKAKVYHVSGSKGYGKSRQGAYMCEKDSVAAGFRGPKGSKKPA